MQQKAVPISITQTVLSTVVWLVFTTSLEGPSRLKLGFHVANGIATLTSILLAAFQVGMRVQAAEFLFVFMLSVPLLCWLCWIYYAGILLRSERRESLGWRLTHSPEVILKLWTDNVVHVLLIILLIIYNQVLQYRSGLADVVIHLIILGVYCAFRIGSMFILSEGNSAFIITEALNIIICTGLAVLAFSAKFIHELRERLRFVRNRDERQKLKDVRVQQLARTSGGLDRHDGQTSENYSSAAASAKTPIEILVGLITKCQLKVRELAFEISTYGDIRMVEADELLKLCKDTVIANSHTDLFTVKDVLRSNTNRLAQDIIRAYSNMATSATIPHSARVATGQEWLNGQTTHQRQKPTITHFPEPPITGKVAECLAEPFGANLLKGSSEPGFFQKFAFEIIQPYLEAADMDRSAIWNYFGIVESLYQPNPYHNHGHGLSVALFGQVIHDAIPLLRDRMDTREAEAEVFTLLLACLCHDVGHPGLNNNFYINEGTSLGALYRDRAILESYHSFLTFRIAQIQPDANIFQELHPLSFRRMRKDIISLILATDMSRHFGLISEMRLKRESETIGNQIDRLDLYKLVIKMADLSHGFLSWDLHVAWSMRIAQEFHQQGELEQKLNLNTSPLCDRQEQSGVDFLKGQASFLEFVVLPLVIEISATGVIPDQFLKRRCIENLEQWKSCAESSAYTLPEVGNLATIQDHNLPMEVIKEYLFTPVAGDALNW